MSATKMSKYRFQTLGLNYHSDSVWLSVAYYTLQIKYVPWENESFATSSYTIIERDAKRTAILNGIKSVGS